MLRGMCENTSLLLVKIEKVISKSYILLIYSIVYRYACAVYLLTNMCEL